MSYSSRSWLPQSVLSIRKGYTTKDFSGDLIAGLTVGSVAIPLAMAFAIASGVAPEAGLYCAVIAGFLISACGGSRLQIGGPTGAFVVIVSGIVVQYGFEGLLLCTVMAGGILIFLGATGLGAAVKFVPRPVVVGFTNGIGVLIASTQIRDFLGLQIASVPGDFPGRMGVLIRNLGTLSLYETSVGATSLALILILMRYFRRVPAYISVLLLATSAAAFFHFPLQTIGTRFGGIPSGLPRFQLPAFSFGLLRSLVSPALTVAMLGAIESLMSAVVADRMSGDKHNPNVELIGQGIANVVTPFFGGLPATGAIARTATNVRSGARTPLAGMIHALTLAAVLLFAAPLAQFIPLASLAAILLVVSYNMGEWREIPELLKLSKLEICVWVTTFALTVFVDLTVAVEAGMVFSVLVYIRKVTSTTTITEVTQEYLEEGRSHTLQNRQIPPYVAVFRIDGPFLFGGTDKLDPIIQRLTELPDILILRLRNMTAIDATGLQALEELADTAHRANRHLLLCGAQPQPAQLMRQADFERHVGAKNICSHIEEALSRAVQLHILKSDPNLNPEFLLQEP
jgi:SulP family sulfate permease